jgi:hypothetical protein
MQESKNAVGSTAPPRRVGELFQVQHRLRYGLHLSDVPEDLAGLYPQPLVAEEFGAPEEGTVSKNATCRPQNSWTRLRYCVPRVGDPAVTPTEPARVW